MHPWLAVAAGREQEGEARDPTTPGGYSTTEGIHCSFSTSSEQLCIGQ